MGNKEVQNLFYRAKALIPKAKSVSIKWVYGYYLRGLEVTQHQILELYDPEYKYRIPRKFPIEISTLGISTGYGHKEYTHEPTDTLFTGDVVQIDSFKPTSFRVVYENGRLGYTHPDTYPYIIDLEDIPADKVTRLGNIFDDPYLLNLQNKYVRSCDTSAWYTNTKNPEASCYYTRLEFRNTSICGTCPLNTVKVRNQHHTK